MLGIESFVECMRDDDDSDKLGYSGGTIGDNVRRA